jgi:ethanolamine transporter EutH
MVIDFRNSIEESKVLFGFLTIVILCLVIGICVGSSVTIETPDQKVTTSSPYCEFSFDILQPLTLLNRFLALGMVFYGETVTKAIPILSLCVVARGRALACWPNSNPSWSRM